MHCPDPAIIQRTRRIHNPITLARRHPAIEGFDQHATGQLVGSQRAPRNGHPHAGDGGTNGQVVAIEHIAASHIHIGRTDLAQVLFPFCIRLATAPGGHVMQQRKMPEIGWLGERRPPRQQRRRADRENILFHHQRNLEARIHPVIQVYRQIEQARQQRLGTVFRFDPQFDLRIAPLEIRQPRHQPFGQKGGHGPQPYDPAEMATIEAVDFEIDRAIGSLNHRQQASPFFGQRQTAWQASEQPKAQPFFQLADLLADRPRRDMQGIGGLGKGQQPATDQEHLEPGMDLSWYFAPIV